MRASRGTQARLPPRARAKKQHWDAVLYRRAPFVVSYWRGDRLVFENFLARRRITANPLTSTVLHFFDRWRPLRELFAALKEYTPASLRKAARSLAQHSFLQKRGRNPAVGEKELLAWSEWNPAASFFHLATKDVEFQPDSEEEYRELLQLAKSNPMPRPVKHYPKARHVRLPVPKADSEFPRVLLARRTWRKFSARPVALSALGNLLGLTWGVQAWVKTPKIGSAALKTSPSGGALHPVEAYVLARNVKGLHSGIYHYNGADHRLELLRRGATSHHITRCLANQWWYGGASFVVFMTAVFARTRWKYDYARAYRAVLMEAGHLCQTFCLTATWLNLAPFCTLAFADSKIEKALGVDGISESVLYVAGAGMRPDNEEQAHLLSGSEISKLNL
jgi:SagB-type dehydrogenase family enzyme